MAASKQKGESPKKVKTASKAQGASKGGAPKGSADVERRWQEYWRCRKDLEEACASVRSAQSELARARELEQSRRRVFEETKNALKALLEVESPAVETSEGSLSMVPGKIVDFETGEAS